MALRIHFKTWLHTVRIKHTVEHYLKVEKSLDVAYNKVVAKLRSSYNLNHPAEDGECHAMVSLEEIFHEETSLRSHRYMSVVQFHVLYETILVQVCKTYADEIHIPLEFPRSEDKVKQCRDYLVAQNITIPSQYDDLWRSKFVRDCFAHSFGYVGGMNPKRQPEIRSQAKAGAFKIDADDQIVLSVGYVTWLASTIDVFLEDLFIAIGWKTE